MPRHNKVRLKYAKVRVAGRVIEGVVLRELGLIRDGLVILCARECRMNET
jgi:hypothetical protein